MKMKKIHLNEENRKNLATWDSDVKGADRKTLKSIRSLDVINGKRFIDDKRE